VANQYVREIRAGDRVDSRFFLQKMTLVPFRDASRGHYLTLTLADRTGQIQGRVWDGAAEVAGRLQEQAVVQVVGMAEEYRGQMQLAVQEVVLLPEQGPALFAEFVPTIRSDIRKLQAQLERALLSIENQHLARLVRWFFARREFYDAYTAAPGAKQIHHAGRGGLLEHSLEVVEFCEAAARLYPMLDRDLLVAGALLHDIGKIREYAVTGSIELTDEGRLFGHTAIGLRMLDQAVAALGDFPRDLADHLGHMILSHLGQLEHGAAALPQTPEAMALHAADMLSAKLKQFEQVIAAGGDADWTPYDRALGRSLYSGFSATKRGKKSSANAGASNGGEAARASDRV
jgi:3'-5' exoribonuclease